MYNFSKTSHDSNYREFKQTMFRRDRHDLLVHIKRKSQATGSQSLPTGSFPSPQIGGNASWDSGTNAFYGDQSGLLNSLISSMTPSAEGIAELMQTEDFFTSESEADGGTDASMKLKIISLQSNIKTLNERYNNLAKNYNLIYSYLFGSGNLFGGENQLPPRVSKKVVGGSFHSDTGSEGDQCEVTPAQETGHPDYSHLLSMPMQGVALHNLGSNDSSKVNKSAKKATVVNINNASVAVSTFSRQSSNDAYGAFSRQSSKDTYVGFSRKNSEDVYGAFSRQRSRDSAADSVIKDELDEHPLRRQNSINPFDLPVDGATSKYSYGELLFHHNSVDDATFRAATSLVSMVSVDAPTDSSLRKRKSGGDDPLPAL